ncbi:unnamed protein product [Moneuplotes crassus]|uniref:Uncharacterized protein n=1 Tax=Euplotes crassus TaxID=5936 RepID=A0AAD1UL99_EUPCR|nr:unnamed protein product [Moneuplotes crassus]
MEESTNFELKEKIDLNELLRICKRSNKEIVQIIRQNPDKIKLDMLRFRLFRTDYCKIREELAYYQVHHPSSLDDYVGDKVYQLKRIDHDWNKHVKMIITHVDKNPSIDITTRPLHHSLNTQRNIPPKPIPKTKKKKPKKPVKPKKPKNPTKPAKKAPSSTPNPLPSPIQLPYDPHEEQYNPKPVQKPETQVAHAKKKKDVKFNWEDEDVRRRGDFDKRVGEISSSDTLDLNSAVHLERSFERMKSLRSHSLKQRTQHDKETSLQKTISQEDQSLNTIPIGTNQEETQNKDSSLEKQSSERSKSESEEDQEIKLKIRRRIQ